MATPLTPPPRTSLDAVIVNTDSAIRAVKTFKEGVAENDKVKSQALFEYIEKIDNEQNRLHQENKHHDRVPWYNSSRLVPLLKEFDPMPDVPLDRPLKRVNIEAPTAEELDARALQLGRDLAEEQMRQRPPTGQPIQRGRGRGQRGARGARGGTRARARLRRGN